jgi:uncharacterized protein involved in response to NO
MKIAEPGRRPAPGGFALWALGFRPFYLGAAACAVLAMAIWLAVLSGVFEWRGQRQLAPIIWHAHEMIFGFAMAVIVGFLFTAGANWSGIVPAKGRLLASLFLLWLGARLALLFDALAVAAFFDISFALLAAGLLLNVFWQARLWRNGFIWGIFLALGGTNAAFYLLPDQALALLEAALLLILMLIIIMGGRVIPMFTQNAVPGLKPWRPAWLEMPAVVISGLALLAWIFSPIAALTAAFCIAAGILNLLRWLGWKPFRTGRNPMLWVLHIGYAWIPLAFLGLGLEVLGEFSRSTAMHMISVGAMGMITLGMMTRTARGHTGRLIKAEKPETAAFALLALAGVLRIAYPYLSGNWAQATLLAAGLCWMAAFAIYFVVYLPWLCRSRIDGKPG